MRPRRRRRRRQHYRHHPFRLAVTNSHSGRRHGHQTRAIETCRLPLARLARGRHLVFMAAHCVTAQGLWSKVAPRKCVMENVGQVEIPPTNRLPRDAQLAQRKRRNLALWPAAARLDPSRNPVLTRPQSSVLEFKFIRPEEANSQKAKRV